MAAEATDLAADAITITPSILPAVAMSVSSPGPEPAVNGTSAAGAPSAARWFDQLLGNTLPIREERTEFPPHIALQGRIIAPPVYRLDQAVTRPLAQGPHFAISQPMDQVHIPVNSVSKPGTEEIIHEEEVVDEFDDAHSSRPSKPHFLRRRADEKTVAAAAVAAKAKSGQTSPPVATELKQSSTRSTPAYSTTPVTDALRHLQGGQP